MAIADVRRSARRAVHNQFALPASYTDPNTGVVTPLAVRWHNKTVAELGNLDNTGYAQTFEAVDTLVFDGDAVISAGIILTRHGVVAFTDPVASFSLDALLPPDGPVNVTWTATRQSSVSP